MQANSLVIYTRSRHSSPWSYWPSMRCEATDLRAPNSPWADSSSGQCALDENGFAYRGVFQWQVPPSLLVPRISAEVVFVFEGNKVHFARHLKRPRNKGRSLQS